MVVHRIRPDRVTARKRLVLVPSSPIHGLQMWDALAALGLHGLQMWMVPRPQSAQANLPIVMPRLRSYTGQAHSTS